MRGRADDASWLPPHDAHAGQREVHALQHPAKGVVPGRGRAAAVVVVDVHLGEVGVAVRAPAAGARRQWQAQHAVVAVHERGGIYDEEDGVLGREWEDVLEWAMEEALGYTWGEEQYDEQEDGGVYSDGC